MEFDYSTLRGRIREKFGTEGNFASAIGMNPSTLSQKLSNKLEFSQEDILASMNALDAGSDCIVPYFFTQKIAN
nr:DUF739 family protein [uncultured Dialister sp.]